MQFMYMSCIGNQGEHRAIPAETDDEDATGAAIVSGPPEVQECLSLTAFFLLFFTR